MSILYMDQSPQPVFEAETGARRATMDELLRDSDVVSVHVPLSAETKGLLNAERFRAMKTGSIVVNTSRGGIVDEEALIWAVPLGTPGLPWRTWRPATSCWRASRRSHRFLVDLMTLHP